MREMCQTFGITTLGETVESWTLENEFLTAEVLTYGATLRRGEVYRHCTVYSFSK